LTLEPGKFFSAMLKASLNVTAACKPVAPKIAANTATLNTFFIVCPLIFISNSLFG
jgi:hypothetical protein